MLTDPFGTNRITRAIVGCAIRVHDYVGPGVYENIYSECLQYELKADGLSFELNRPALVVYKGVRLKSKYYLDMVVENLVAAELKSIEMLLAVHRKQLQSQLRLTNLPVGLLINFNVDLLTNGGVKRVVNPKYKPVSDSPDGAAGSKVDEAHGSQHEVTK
jgi:GxxExxY protein